MRLKLYAQRNRPQKSEWLGLTKLRDSSMINMALILGYSIYNVGRDDGQSHEILAVTLTDFAGKLVNAVSPQTSTNPNSPSKLVDLCGKYSN